jgi:hypothetical protein
VHCWRQLHLLLKDRISPERCADRKPSSLTSDANQEFTRLVHARFWDSVEKVAAARRAEVPIMRDNPLYAWGWLLPYLLTPTIRAKRVLLEHVLQPYERLSEERLNAMDSAMRQYRKLRDAAASASEALARAVLASKKNPESAAILEARKALETSEGRLRAEVPVVLGHLADAGLSQTELLKLVTLCKWFLFQKISEHAASACVTETKSEGISLDAAKHPDSDQRIGDTIAAPPVAKPSSAGPSAQALASFARVDDFWNGLGEPQKRVAGFESLGIPLYWCRPRTCLPWRGHGRAFDHANKIREALKDVITPFSRSVRLEACDHWLATVFAWMVSPERPANLKQELEVMRFVWDMAAVDREGRAIALMVWDKLNPGEMEVLLHVAQGHKPTGDQATHGFTIHSSVARLVDDCLRQQGYDLAAGTEDRPLSGEDLIHSRRNLTHTVWRVFSEWLEKGGPS